MKHISSFNGAITSLLTTLGLDSAKVLSACNAWLGSQKADEAKTKVTGKVTLTGKVSTKGEDKRKLNISESEKRSAKVGYSVQGALVALSDALNAIVERHDASVKLVEFPPEITTWLEAKVESFKPTVESKPEDKKPEETPAPVDA